MVETFERKLYGSNCGMRPYLKGVYKNQRWAIVNALPFDHCSKPLRQVAQSLLQPRNRHRQIRTHLHPPAIVTPPGGQTYSEQEGRMAQADQMAEARAQAAVRADQPRCNGGDFSSAANSSPRSELRYLLIFSIGGFGKMLARMLDASFAVSS